MERWRGEQVYCQTPNGRVYRCAACNKIHVEYKTLSFSFNPAEYHQFRDYIQQLDPEFWAAQNQRHNGERKILIPINHPTLMMKFRPEEVDELKELLVANFKPGPPIRQIKSRQIGFQLSNN